MKVIYLGVNSRYSGKDPSIPGDVIELRENNWDDFGYKTTFPTVCRINGELVELGNIKLLIDGVATTSAYLAELKANGWNGVFPLPNTSYISVPSEITFYGQINALLGNEGAIKVAEILRDAGYLARIKEDKNALRLISTEGFKSSLQRERSDQKSFFDGWKIFVNDTEISISDFKFTFINTLGKNSVLDLKFGDREILPHEINVLIGANGVGKSQLLLEIVKTWISDEKQKIPVMENLGFFPKPNISQIVVVSYSPFEMFPVDLKRYNLADKNIYRYFGFRERDTAEEISTRIILTHDAPKKNAAYSLLSCVKDDQRFYVLEDWGKKLKTVYSVLKSAINFEFAAIRVNPELNPSIYFKSNQVFPNSVLDYNSGKGIERYISIHLDQILNLNIPAIEENCILQEGVTFFSGQEKLKLSSGQRLFSFIVINILGAIRRDSLILIDEPELFLHPNLEIQFIQMLKEILVNFNSKALIATHSVVTVREIPSECVHVMQKTEDGLKINHPPFQTFGGDVQRITSYVFGDNAVSKPFEAWIASMVDKYPTPNALIGALEGQLNEELIIQIRALYHSRRIMWPF